MVGRTGETPPVSSAVATPLYTCLKLDCSFRCGCAGRDCVVVLVAVGQFSCGMSSPCTYDNIMTFGYYYPHYDSTMFIKCGQWDPVAMYATCTERSCPLGTVWDQTNGRCNYPVNVGSSKCYCACFVAILHVHFDTL